MYGWMYHIVHPSKNRNVCEKNWWNEGSQAKFHLPEGFVFVWPVNTDVTASHRAAVHTGAANCVTSWTHFLSCAASRDDGEGEMKAKVWCKEEVWKDQRDAEESEAEAGGLCLHLEVWEPSASKPHCWTSRVCAALEDFGFNFKSNMHQNVSARLIFLFVYTLLNRSSAFGSVAASTDDTAARLGRFWKTCRFLPSISCCLHPCVRAVLVL